jgi:hypothetical protein
MDNLLAIIRGTVASESIPKLKRLREGPDSPVRMILTIARLQRISAVNGKLYTIGEHECAKDRTNVFTRLMACSGTTGLKSFEAQSFGAFVSRSAGHLKLRNLRSAAIVLLGDGERCELARL